MNVDSRDLMVAAPKPVPMRRVQSYERFGKVLIPIAIIIFTIKVGVDHVVHGFPVVAATYEHAVARTAQGISSLMVPLLRGARPTGAAVFRVIGELAREMQDWLES